MLKIYRINYAFLQWDVGIMSYKITKKLEAITKTLFTFIRGLDCFYNYYDRCNYKSLHIGLVLLL